MVAKVNGGYKEFGAVRLGAAQRLLRPLLLSFSLSIPRAVGEAITV